MLPAPGCCDWTSGRLLRQEKKVTRKPQHVSVHVAVAVAVERERERERGGEEMGRPRPKGKERLTPNPA